MEVGCYVPAPIPHWERLKTKGYSGPKTIWTRHLVDAGVDYRSQRFRGCEEKVKKSLDMDWNYLKTVPGRMEKLASVFLKVEENLTALRDWDLSQEKRAAVRVLKLKARPSRREVMGS